jgi:hypothetical protein
MGRTPPRERTPTEARVDALTAARRRLDEREARRRNLEAELASYGRSATS